MPVNNVEKSMGGKGNPKEMKVADADPMTHIELELMDNMKRVFEEAKKEGFKGTFKDFLDTLSDEEVRTLFLREGGIVRHLKKLKGSKN